MESLLKGLYVVSTPIGNLNDISFRAIKVLMNSDFIVCEDTRHSLKLLNTYKIKKKLISFHKYNENKKKEELIRYLKSGKILSLISDAGTPILSDPGNILIKECIKNKINIFPIPGASSITTAISVAGFDDKFLFFGFLPKKQNELDKVLENLKVVNFCLIFFSPGNKINFYLKNFKKNMSNRNIVIAREMTKIHESFYRDTVENINYFTKTLKGEITIVLSQPTKVKEVIKDINIKIIAKAKKLLKKYSLKDTVDIIYSQEKVPRKTIYKICLEEKNKI